MYTRLVRNHKDYAEYLRVHRTDYRVNEEYRGTQSKISHTHLACGYTWDVRPANLRRGQGCPQCGFRSMSVSRTHTSVSYVEWLSKNNPTYIANEDYKGMRVKISHSHVICGHTWLTTPDVIKRATKCPACAATITDHASYENYVRNKKPDYRINEEYKGSKVKISHTHLLCGYTWDTAPESFTKAGCPDCSARGIKPGKPVTGYILLFDGFLKFGITNNLKSRLKDHKRNGEYSVHYTALFENGEKGVEWEKKIKQHFGYAKGAVPKEMCPDGYTETLPLFLIDELDELVNQIL